MDAESKKAGSSSNDNFDKSSTDLKEQIVSASENGDLITIKRLVEVWHVDPHSCQDEYDINTTPLHLASEYGHLNVVRYLVEEKNCDLKCTNEDEDTPLHVAARGGRLDIVQYLISESGCDPMCRDRYGRNPLQRACQNNKLDVVQYLIEDVKVDSSCQNYDTGATPLHLAAEFGRLDVVQSHGSIFALTQQQ